MPNITQLLVTWNKGDQDALTQLTPLSSVSSTDWRTPIWLAGGAGKTWTKAEQEAGADATRQMTQEVPEPQTIYLIDAAKQENKIELAHFAEKLMLHAQTEEEILYPAAVLIGEYLKMKSR
jgi:hypothetical protein